MSWFGEFIVTPGAGGVGAFFAAAVIGGTALVVSRHRRQDADRDRLAAARQASLEQWWTRYVWLVSTDGGTLPLEGRAEMVAHLIRTAKDLNATELTTAAEVYRAVLNRWLAQAIEQAAQ